MEKRSIGPVTTGAGGGAALALLIAWTLGEFFKIDMPIAVQGALSLLLAVIGGYLVKPARGAHSK